MQIRALFAVAALLICPAISRAQKPAPVPTHANPDQLGMSCAQIPAMSSTDWIAKFNAARGSGPVITIRGINVYGKCYEARTDQLAAALGRSGKGPLMGARGNFKSLQMALKSFTVKALASTQPPADHLKTAYAALYADEFRYEFYESYEPKSPVAVVRPVAAPAADATGATSTPSAAKPDQEAVERAAQEKSDADPLTQAKNHFGELLGDLPADQLHDLHAAFGQILGPNDATSHMQVLVYRYAIFLLETPGTQPFAAPPF